MTPLTAAPHSTANTIFVESGATDFRQASAVETAPVAARQLFAVTEIENRLSNYAEIDEVAGIVDESIRNTSQRQFAGGFSGDNVSQSSQYIYLRDGGFIDLRHVVSAANNPFSHFGEIAGLVVELGQFMEGSPSAFESEDFWSNTISASAARTFRLLQPDRPPRRGVLPPGRNRSIGQIVADMLRLQRPLSQSDAQQSFIERGEIPGP